MHSTVCFLAQCKLNVFFLLLKNFNIFSLSQNLKNWYVVEIQLYVKCQGLLKFNATTDERLKKKSLKYCTFFMDRELKLDFNTSVKNYTHTHTLHKKSCQTYSQFHEKE